MSSNQKRNLLTFVFVFAAAFVLLFSFHKEKIKTGAAEKNTPAPVTAVTSENPPPKSATAKIFYPQEKLAEEPAPEGNEAVENFFAVVPTIEDLNLSSDEAVHETPVAVLKAGEYLAKMRRYFEDFPQNRAVEMGFYLKCSQQKNFFESIRAVCAARLSRQYFEVTGHEISEEIFDKRIDALRRKINL
jgi:hypothetical protein